MLGHGIGLVETLTGLNRFLTHTRQFLSDGGQVLFDSLDLRKTDSPAHLAYQEANRRAGRYFGEIRLQFESLENVGSRCGWLHVDAESMKVRAEKAGWRFEVVLHEDSGEYLGRLIINRAVN